MTKAREPGETTRYHGLRRARGHAVPGRIVGGAGAPGPAAMGALSDLARRIKPCGGCAGGRVAGGGGGVVHSSYAGLWGIVDISTIPRCRRLV